MRVTFRSCSDRWTSWCLFQTLSSYFSSLWTADGSQLSFWQLLCFSCKHLVTKERLLTQTPKGWPSPPTHLDQFYFMFPHTGWAPEHPCFLFWWSRTCFHLAKSLSHYLLVSFCLYLWPRMGEPTRHQPDNTQQDCAVLLLTTELYSCDSIPTSLTWLCFHVLVSFRLCSCMAASHNPVALALPSAFQRCLAGCLPIPTAIQLAADPRV